MILNTKHINVSLLMVLFCLHKTTAAASLSSAISLTSVGGVALLGVGLAWMYHSTHSTLNHLSPSQIFTPAPNTLKGQTILITGATTGLGLESAKRLSLGGAHIILTARSDAKGQAAIEAVKNHYISSEISKVDTDIDSKLSYQVLDLDDLQSVRDAVASLKRKNVRIDVLLNNAGIMALPERQLTKDGIERQIQSNHLGHFLLTALLSKENLLSNNALIINVSSEGHKFAFLSGLDLDYAWRAEPPSSYGGWKSYGQTKLANILFTQELQRRVDESSSQKNWTVVCLHPGAVNTDLSRNLMGNDRFERLKSGQAGWLQTSVMNLMAMVIKSVETGANTQVWLASLLSPAYGNEVLQAVRGHYLSDYKVRSLFKFARDRAAAARLWSDSEKLANVQFII